MVGAEREVYERIKPAFKQFASLVVHAGEPGAGTRMKLARNMLTFTSLRRRMRGDEARRGELGSIFSSWAGWCGTPTRRAAVRARSSSGTNMATLEPDNFLYGPFAHARGLGEKDLSLALALGEAVGVDLPLAEVALQEPGGRARRAAAKRRSERWTNCARRASRR